MSKFNIGDKVKFIGKSDDYILDYGDVGTVVYVIQSKENIYVVNWNCGSFQYSSVCNENNIELVIDMTNEEIWEMLKPKMEKNGLKKKMGGLYIGKKLVDGFWMYSLDDVHNAIALAYKVGYLRAIKGRPFKIGEKKVEEKKQGGHWEPIKENQTIPLKGRVRYSRHDKTADDFQIPIGATGEIRLIDALDHSTMLFTVYLDKMIESTYIQWVVGVPAHCYDMWVEDDE